MSKSLFSLFPSKDPSLPTSSYLFRVENPRAKPVAKARSPDGLVVDVNIVYAKSSNHRIGVDLNPISSQTSPSSSTVKLSPTDLKSPNGTTHLLCGSRMADSKVPNRQNSIVHGYQHSRNASSASTISSQLSSKLTAVKNGEETDTFNMGSAVANFTSPTSNPLNSLPSNKIAASDQSTLAVEDATQAPALQRLGRLQSSERENRDYQHHHSYSRPPKEDSKTVSEYTLHVLFTSFIAQAEKKINQCNTAPLDPEPHLERICGPGSDPTFDQLISALGHIASKKPKPLIDSMMLWRKNKSDAAHDARAQLYQCRQLPRRNTEPSPPFSEGSLTTSSQLSIAERQEFLAQAERCSIVSIYILCRILMEVISQSTLETLTPEMGEKLEGIIFGQLKMFDADQLNSSPMRLANWTLYSQLLGAMSEISFQSVAERFMTDLEMSLREMLIKSPSSRELEGNIELLLGGMRFLRIKVQPEEAWDQSCDFIISMGRFFARLHGHRLKYACCQTLEVLLLPVAAQADTELNTPKWAEILGTIGPLVASMLVKPRHWAAAFPLTAILLCLSPLYSFTTQWLQLVLPLQPKFKDRSLRPICLKVISQLLWTYLYRSPPDSLNITIKKLDEVLKLILPAGRKTYLTTDPSSAHPLIEIIRIIGFIHQEFCFRTIISPLINFEMFISGREIKIEQLEPEKIVIGIKAFLAIMSDLEKGEKGRPAFPQNYHSFSMTDRFAASSTLGSHSTSSISFEFKTEENQFSRPFFTTYLSDVVVEYYSNVCEILSKIIILCDSVFGGYAALDERYNSPIPKTPLSESFNFARRDDHQISVDSKQSFYELLHVAVQALPRFVSNEIPLNTIINILCTGTAHAQDSIAESSANSLKAIARQSSAERTTTSYSRFILNIDDKYPMTSEGGVLGPFYIENTLHLYIELLQIWVEEIVQKIKGATNDTYDERITKNQTTTLDLSVLRARVDEIEVHGLFFLCSQSRKAREFAVTILRLVREFDKALGSNSGRIIHILEEDWKIVITFNDKHLSVAERSRLQMGLKIGNHENALIEICFNETSYDMTLWLKIFPNLIRICYDRCPLTVTLVKELMSNRILIMYKSIVALSEVTRGLHYGSTERQESSSSRMSSRSSATSPEVLIEQWKLYIIFSCTTMSNIGGYPQSSPLSAQHHRKGSKQNHGQEKITSARILFRYIIPLLSTSSASIRDSVVVSLGSINISIYKTLLEELQGSVSKCNEDAKARIHQRATSNPLKNRRPDLMRTEVTHVYRLTAHYLKDSAINQDEWIIGNIVAYTKELKLFLMDGEVQVNWDYHKLRRHFCGLMEELFEGINLAKNSHKWMTFESRKSSFTLMEDWCGFSPIQSQAFQREISMKQAMLDHHLHGERGIVTAAVEVEKRNLRTAALSAMAALCAGPLSFTTENGVNLQFDIRRMLSWIDAVLSAGSDRMNSIGKKALWNLISHNLDFPYLVEHSIARCYITEQPKIIESYFDVIINVLLEYPDYSVPFWRLLAIGLFTLGSETAEIRSKSVNFLRLLEDRQQRNSKIQDYKITISDRTRAIYKLAQSEISRCLSNQYPDVAFFIFSEFTAYFKNLSENAQLNMIAVLIPWVQLIELQVDSNGGLTSQSYAFLCNMCEITTRSSGPLQTDVKALWQALTIEPHASNLQPILSFIMSLCLDRREQNSVKYAKQTVIFLSETSAGNGVIEFLLLQIKPKSMVPNDKCELIPPTTDVIKVPYIANLNEVLPIGTKTAGSSLGQLSLILLVDLILSPSQLIIDNLPLLLQVVTSLWDHYIPTVQDQAREMLIHLIHVLVLPKVDENTHPSRKSIEDFVQSIRNFDPIISWSYEDHSGNDESDSSIPLEMKHLAMKLNETFELTFPKIKENWATLSLNWATSCTMRHIACRSFQVFRCLSASLDQTMLAEMLARLSNTIADDDSEIQAFSIEILITLKTFINKLDNGELARFPQLFWVICACLDTVNEREFREVLRMLQEFMARLDLGMSNVRSLFTNVWPTRWEGNFEGLQSMIYKGLRSSTCLDMSLELINKLTQLPNDDLIGDNSRLLFAILANFPKFLHAMDQNSIESNTAQNALLLAEISTSYGCSGISRVLYSYAGSIYRTSREFLVELVSAIKDIFLPFWDFRGLVFLIGFLTNNLSWFKLKTMHILCAFIAEIDMSKPEITSYGADLISPLLRLLQTEYCMQALEVLDQIMIMGGTSMDKQYLRMSMTLLPSKIIRKGYAHTPSLFGIPEDSGWSVPFPAKYAEMTRANVLTVFYSCQNSENMNTDSHMTHKFHEVKFHNDDFHYGYIQSPEKAETLLSDEGRGEGNISDLIVKLDSLDEFFENSLRSPSDNVLTSSKSPQPCFSYECYESDARVYEEQTLPILSKSLGTPPNNSSFQNGFTDIRTTKPNTMNPAAFYPLSPNRPSLHSRSVTSPSAPASSKSNVPAYMSDDEYNEVFSDGDEERHAPHVEGSFFLENIIKPLPQGIRSGMRRLTGGRNRDNDRLRENLRGDKKGHLPPLKSPRVPKVPSAYLHKAMMSSGL